MGIAHAGRKVAAGMATLHYCERGACGPDGAGWVACAELVARGIESFSAGGLRLPKLRLPAWHRDGTDEYTVHQCQIGGSDHKEKGPRLSGQGLGRKRPDRACQIYVVVA